MCSCTVYPAQAVAAAVGGDTDSPGRPGGRAGRSSDVGFYFDEARRMAAAVAGAGRTQSQPGELLPDGGGGGSAQRHGVVPVRHNLLESPLGRQLASRGGDGSGAAGGRGGGGRVDYTPSPQAIRQVGLDTRAAAVVADWCRQ